MTDAGRESLELRVLALSPTGKDAALTQAILGRAGVACVSCTDLDQVCEEMERGAGVLLVAEEAVQTRHARLSIWLARQPPWSDLPVLVLARRGAESATVGRAMDLLGNVTVLERPIRVSALVSAVRTALRARQRQYEAREHLSLIERSERDLHVTVSELRQSQRTLEASEQRFRSIFKNAGVSLWEEDFSGVMAAVEDLRAQGITDFDRYFREHPEFVTRAMEAIRVLDVNEATVEMFEARNKRELLGSLPRIFNPESMPVFRAELSAVAAGRPFFEAEALLSTVRGNPVNVYFTMVLPVPGQSYDRVLFSVIDITALKRAEDLLKQADRRKDEFLAILAHELRNPLAPIRNSLHILRLTARQDPGIERIAEMMERQVNLMVRLVDDLLEVSRITRGKIQLRKEKVEVADVVRSAVETSRPLIDAGGQRLTLEIPPEPLVLEGDPIRLAQILANLLNNAAKYTEPGGRIDLSVARESRDVVISVRDTGIGIPPAMLPRIFELFTQVEHLADRAQGGLGIGLTLVRNLTEMHGGSVTARSEGPGQGSEFLVRLPLVAERLLKGTSLTKDRPAVIRAPRRVMVVDDNRDSAESLATVLNLLGADTHVEYSGADALEALATYKPDVLLLDIGMPDMNGYEVARRIRQEPKLQDLTLVALTGWGQESDRQRSEIAGFDYHLIKPADINALQAVLDSPGGRRRGGSSSPLASTAENPSVDAPAAENPRVNAPTMEKQEASELPRLPAS